MDHIKKIKYGKQEGFFGQRMLVVPPDAQKKMTAHPFISSFYPTAIGFYPNAINHDLERPAGSTDYIMLYCIQGEGSVEIENQKVHLGPNTYLIIPPKTPHRYNSSFEHPWSIYWVHFLGDHANRIFKYVHQDPVYYAHPLAYNEQQIQLFNSVIDHLQKGYELKNLELIHILLLYFFSKIAYKRKVNTIPSEDMVSRCIAFMKSNLKEPIKLDELSRRYNLSNSRFSELFKEQTGYSPISYLIQMKMQQACQYLYFTDYSIKEICHKVGFEDPYYFSRMFKKIMGISPSLYRNSYKK